MPAGLGTHRFISHFPAALRARLKKHIRVVRFPNRAVIFPEGSPSDCVYLVIAGRVALTRKSAAGVPHLIANKGPDDYFGELGVLDGSVRSTTAIADGPVQLGRLEREPFVESLAQCTWQTVVGLFSYVSEELRATNDRYVGEVVRKEKITLIGEMANQMVHDFRAPFSTIKLATELMAKRSPAPETQALCAMVLRQVDRLGGMVEEVLDFARGETHLRVKPVSLQDTLLQLQENTLEILARTGIRLRVKPTTIMLPLDADRFLRVLQNLVANARDVLAPRQHGTVAVAARRRGRNAVITVSDDGPGIPVEIRGALFEPFVSQGKPNGTGLGLAIAKSVVVAHGGSIDFHTSREGTTFTITLPLGDEGN